MKFEMVSRTSGKEKKLCAKEQILKYFTLQIKWQRFTCDRNAEIIFQRNQAIGMLKMGASACQIGRFFDVLLQQSNRACRGCYERANPK